MKIDIDIYKDITIMHTLYKDYTLNKLIDIISDYFNINWQEWLSRLYTETHLIIRRFVIYFLRKFGYSYKEIIEIVGAGIQNTASIAYDLRYIQEAINFEYNNNLQNYYYYTHYNRLKDLLITDLIMELRNGISV